MWASVNLIARGSLKRLIALLLALLSVSAMASTAQAADSTAARPDVQAIAVHAAYEAGADFSEPHPADAVDCVTGGDDHWFG